MSKLSAGGVVKPSRCRDACQAARQSVQSAAAHSHGSLERAALWCDAEVVEFRRELVQILGQAVFDLQPAAKLIGQFTDAAGKDSFAKRQRLRLVVSLAEEFYRAILLK